jgi:hypothetical protein
LRYPARLDPRPWRLIARWFRGRARIEYLNIVSHHFMGRTELATATGRERLALCVFKAPVGDRLVSMCELNALGLRDQYYGGLRESGPPNPRQKLIFGYRRLRALPSTTDDQ